MVQPRYPAIFAFVDQYLLHHHYFTIRKLAGDFATRQGDADPKIYNYIHAITRYLYKKLNRSKFAKHTRHTYKSLVAVGLAEAE